MHDFASAHATGANPEAIADALVGQLHVDGHTVGFLYVTSPLAQGFGRLLAALRRRTGIDSWVGTAGHGICASGVEHWAGPAAVALTCRTPSSPHRRS